jgi:long-chain fatty acid transport protein
LADGVVLNGVSPRSLSRGGTNLGHADNGGVLHDNPAAMVNMNGCEMWEVGTIGLFSSFQYSDLENPGGATSSEFTPLAEFSWVRKSCDGIWAFGLGVFPEAGFAEEYAMQGPFPFAGPREYKSFGALCKVLPGVSCRLTDRLSVGATFGLGISHAEFEGPYFLQGPGLFAGTPTLMDLKGTGVTPVWSLGLQYQLTESTTIGATYLSASRVELEGDTQVTLPGPMGSASYESELEVEWPQSVGIGIRQQLGPCQAVSADLIWFGWSSAFDQFQLGLQDPSNPFFPQIDETIPLNWRDTLSVRIGFEREIAIGGTLRLGYVYHRNPIPAATLTPFIQGTLEHSLSIGYGWRWGGWEIDAGYMYLFGEEQPVVDSQLLGGDFDSSSHDAAVHAVFVGLQKRL